jgi:bilirubin oxidase
MINVTNQLVEATTTHWHGIHLPAEMDGGPHQPIAAGATWSPTFTVSNDAATYWYHPHLHSKTMEQLSYGAGGLIIINDAHEASLPLPRNYGSDDIPLVLTSRRFLDNNAFDTTAIYGDVQLSNGTSNATITLPAQFVRIRLLNAEVERAYNLGFHDDRIFYVIASDGGLLNRPVPVTRLPLAVGERYEILVDLQHDSVGSTLEFLAYNGGQPFGFPGGEMPVMANSVVCSITPPSRCSM